MEYSIYKLDFHTGVHLGNGMLNDSDYTFGADQLFSALYIEGIKLCCEQKFYSMVHEGRLLFSDTFPYVGKQYMVPKPMLYVEPVKRGSSEQKKIYKKMKFIPVDSLEAFFNGTQDFSYDPMENYGYFEQQPMACVRRDEETKPFRVGTFYYAKDCGLYVIAAHESSEEKYMLEELLEALSYTGIGGKKMSGLGKFTLRPAKLPEIFSKYLQQDSGVRLLLSTALPKEDELSEALDGASYKLIKRSGFVASTEYAPESRKKRDLYVCSAGSCFKHCFKGDIYDVSDGGNHSVYRYAKPLFMGVGK